MEVSKLAAVRLFQTSCLLGRFMGSQAHTLAVSSFPLIVDAADGARHLAVEASCAAGDTACTAIRMSFEQMKSCLERGDSCSSLASGDGDTCNSDEPPRNLLTSWRREPEPWACLAGPLHAAQSLGSHDHCGRMHVVAPVQPPPFAVSSLAPTQHYVSRSASFAVAPAPHSRGCQLGRAMTFNQGGIHTTVSGQPAVWQGSRLQNCANQPGPANINRLASTGQVPLPARCYPGTRQCPRGEQSGINAPSPIHWQGIAPSFVFEQELGRASGLAHARSNGLAGASNTGTWPPFPHAQRLVPARVLLSEPGPQSTGS